jgi:hypothetical protein
MVSAQRPLSICEGRADILAFESGRGRLTETYDDGTAFVIGVVSHHVARPRLQSCDAKKRVDRDPAELHAQLGPGGHAVDVTGIGGPRQSVDLVPCPGGRMRDEALDRVRPRRHDQVGG